MLDDLYDRDSLAWSEHQAELSRQVARGARVMPPPACPLTLGQPLNDNVPALEAAVRAASSEKQP